MSLTSYRAAPPRVTMLGWLCQPGSVFCGPFRRCRSGRRAAPPRGLYVRVFWRHEGGHASFLVGPSLGPKPFVSCEWVFVLVCFHALASMPGDVLLFQRLSVSTIGAVRFHGRVRDGIGWVTDAMATKQWSERVNVHEGF
jgi:hypothetical protein